MRVAACDRGDTHSAALDVAASAAGGVGGGGEGCASWVTRWSAAAPLAPRGGAPPRPHAPSFGAAPARRGPPRHPAQRQRGDPSRGQKKGLGATNAHRTPVALRRRRYRSRGARHQAARPQARRDCAGHFWLASSATRVPGVGTLPPGSPPPAPPFTRSWPPPLASPAPFLFPPLHQCVLVWL